MSCKNITVLSARTLLLLIITGSTLVAGCKTQEVPTQWSAEPVQVDGEMTGWDGMPTTYFEELGAQLGLCNDGEKLYVLFRFNNESWARAIRTGGVTLWLDNSGKKKKDLGIRYTGGRSLPGMHKSETTDRGGFRESLTPEQQQRLAEVEETASDQITIIDKKNSQEKTMRADGSGGPAVSFASPQGTYTYEFSIPLKKGDVFDCGIGAEPGQVICLGLEWGGMGKQNRQRMMDRMGGGPPAGMGGGPPGGGGGGPRGGGGMQPPEEQELWVKTRLASPADG
jgi:hypothetical protein